MIATLIGLQVIIFIGIIVSWVTWDDDIFMSMVAIDIMFSSMIMLLCGVGTLVLGFIT